MIDQISITKSPCLTKSVVRALMIPVLTVLLISEPAYAQGADKPSRTVITVGSNNINRGQIESLVSLMEKQQGPERPVTDQDRARLRQMIATNLIGQELVGLEAKRLKIAAQPQEIDSAFQILKAAYPDDKVFTSTLAQAGDTEKSLREKLARQIVQDKLLDTQVPAPTEPTEKDLQAFYASNKKDFPVNDTLRASQIVLLAPKNATAAAAKAKKEQLDKIRAELLRDSADFPRLVSQFTALAANYSETPEKQRGGDLGRFAPGDFKADFSGEVKKMEMGQLSPVFRTSMGWHLVLLTEKNDGKFSSYRFRIAQFLMTRETMEKAKILRDFLQSLAKKYPVKYLDPSYRDTSANAIYKS